MHHGVFIHRVYHIRRLKTWTTGWSENWRYQEDPEDPERRAFFKLQRTAACDLIAAGKVSHAKFLRGCLSSLIVVHDPNNW